MHISLYILEGPWPGHLAVSANPRGGSSLHTEVLAWRGEHINTVVSLLVPREAAELDLEDEEEICILNQIDFVSFPIGHRSVPSSYLPALELMSGLDSRLSRGENVLIHSRQGVGRSAIIGAGLLIYRGIDPKKAVQRVIDVRGILVPETREQLEWLGSISSNMTVARPLG